MDVKDLEKLSKKEKELIKINRKKRKEFEEVQRKHKKELDELEKKCKSKIDPIDNERDSLQREIRTTKDYIAKQEEEDESDCDYGEYDDIKYQYSDLEQEEEQDDRTSASMSPLDPNMIIKMSEWENVASDEFLFDFD